MKILAIETSCDDTCISIIQIKEKKSNTASFEILSNIVSSQVKLHAKYGGVYPTLAKREHQRNLPLILKKVLKKANFAISNFQFPISKQYSRTKFLISKQILNSNFQIPKPNIDLIAVTTGPGLEPCLWTGINFAKEISKKWNLPIIPVNHIEAHILANFLPKISSNFQFSISNFQNIFPAICLIVSGGHTQLILMEDFGKYKILGETRDDAAGECFDKTARMLGLGYPGGPAIAAEAAKFQITNTKSQISTKFKITNSKQIPNSKFQIKLPRPMMYQKNYDFSFSGLKTAVLYEVKKKKRKSQKFIRTMCWEIQQAIIDVLIYKTIKAAKDYEVKSIILGGGVTANQELRKQFKSKLTETGSPQLLIPSKNLCIDNAAMIGITAYFNLKKKSSLAHLRDIKADANMKID